MRHVLYPIVVLLACSASALAQSRPASLPGFEISPHFGEQVKTYRLEPEVTIHINAPSPEAFDRTKPTRLVFYALPNANTIDWTIGRKMAPGLDWHYNIQHIGAQMRRMRETVGECNWVVAYLEADKRAWPTWKRRHTDYRQLIPRIVDDVVKQLGPGRISIILSGHSGGGSFVLGYIDSFEHIPAQVERISFLDSNYGYDDELKHGDKLIEWLRGGREHCLSVICYDDRNVTLNGKPVIGPTGGTWRRTQQMLERLKKNMELKESTLEGVIRYRGMNGQVDILMHPNPENKILHTALVGPMNGLIHALTCGTSAEDKAGRFNGGVAYEKWIQP